MASSRTGPHAQSISTSLAKASGKSSASGRKRLPRPVRSPRSRSRGSRRRDEFLPPTRKSLGQHFLRDPRILTRIAAAAHLTSQDTVVEVGPGTGALTAHLLGRAGQVIAVEIDEELCAHLRHRFSGASNLSLVCADVLSLAPPELLEVVQAQPPYVVTGNLPYNIASAVVRHFLEADARPTRMIVMMQKEVAESIVAGPGKMSLPALGVQFYASPKLLFAVPPTAFYPRPKVTSAVVRIDVRERPAVEVDDAKAFFRLLRAAFGTPRKQLRNTLSHALKASPDAVAVALRAAGVDPQLRPQALGLKDWQRVYEAFRRASLLVDGGE